MIDLGTLKGSRFAVLGLARSGMATARALRAGGVEFVAWDDDEYKRQQAADAGVPLKELTALDWGRIDALVLSPGIPHSHPQPHPIAALAKEHQCGLIGDIELLWRAWPDARAATRPRFVGITGTNGKSTTTALIGHILHKAGRNVQVGGNLGQPVLDFAALAGDGIYVLEMSSYQLELVDRLRFDVAVLLNITPDHLDRHGGMDGYIAAKQRVFRHQRVEDHAIVGIDSAPSNEIYNHLRSAPMRRVPISVGARSDQGVSVVAGQLYDAALADAAPIDLNGILTLPGAHNWQNAAAAYATCRALGLDPHSIAAGLRSYPGLPHRQERVAVIGGITYVNDSKATNADAAEKALASYETIYWIAGGRAKDGGIAALTRYFPRIVHAFLIGEASGQFAATLAGKVAVSPCGDLASALQSAHAMAQREKRHNAVVLLSPSCASFDQWPSYEARGDAFRAQVRLLAGKAA